MQVELLYFTYRNVCMASEMIIFYNVYARIYNNIVPIENMTAMPHKKRIERWRICPQNVIPGVWLSF